MCLTDSAVSLAYQMYEEFSSTDDKASQSDLSLFDNIDETSNVFDRISLLNAFACFCFPSFSPHISYILQGSVT